jgi:hypothetical protein
MQPEIHIFHTNFHEFEENTAIGHTEDNLNLYVTKDKMFQSVFRIRTRTEQHRKWFSLVRIRIRYTDLDPDQDQRQYK